MKSVVSIITPNFNRGEIIGETANSIFNQTYSNWEWIIVDDGSTDNSWEILKNFKDKDKRVKLFKRDREPKGACTCRNIAIGNASGEFVMFLDTDDLLASFCLEQRINAFNIDSDCDFIIFPMLLFKKKPDDLKLLWSIENGKDDLKRILEGDPICQGTGTLWKKTSFEKVGMWKESLNLWQDIELHIRSILWPMKYKKRMDLLPDVFLRISDISLSRTGYHSLPKLQSRILVFSEAVEMLQAKDCMIIYFESLKFLGWNIILSAINSSFFLEANWILNFCQKNNLFKTEDVRRINHYYFIRKYKLYKVKPINNFYLKKISSVMPQPSSTGSVKWDKPVVI